MMDRDGESLHRPAGGPPPFNKGGSGGEPKKVEYTGTMRLDISCIMWDRADQEAYARYVWDAIAHKLPEALEEEYEGVQVTSSEIKIFVRDLE